MEVASDQMAHRVVVRSIGKATPALYAALSKVLPLSSEQIVRCLYQAPSVLLDGLAMDQAQTIGDMLSKAGLLVEVAPKDAELLQGGPDFEIAVYVGDIAQFRAVSMELARFLGCEPGQALRLLCASPAVVLGQVSEATLLALSTAPRK